MRDVGGKTVGLVDYGHKRRHDHMIEDERTRQACMARIQRRLVPEIKRAFQFEVTRMERYIVACYDASDRKSTRLNSSHIQKSRMPSSA